MRLSCNFVNVYAVGTRAHPWFRIRSNRKQKENEPRNVMKIRYAENARFTSKYSIYVIISYDIRRRKADAYKRGKWYSTVVC